MTRTTGTPEPVDAAITGKRPEDRAPAQATKPSAGKKGTTIPPMRTGTETTSPGKTTGPTKNPLTNRTGTGTKTTTKTRRRTGTPVPPPSNTQGSDTTTRQTGNTPAIPDQTTTDTDCTALCQDLLTRPATLAKIRRKVRYHQNRRLELSRTTRRMEQDTARRVEEEYLNTKNPRLSNADKRRLETGRRLEGMSGYKKCVNQREELQTILYTLEDDLISGRETLRAEIAVLMSYNPAPVIVSGMTGVTPETIHKSGQLIVPDPTTPEDHPCTA